METGRIFQAMTEGLREDGWEFIEIPDHSSVLFVVEACNGYFVCYSNADEDREQVVFHTRIDVKAPIHRRGDAAEYLMRANARVTAGSFDFDFDTGTARFRAASTGCAITTQVMRSLVLPSLEAADDYLPGFLAVCAGTLSPREAIKLTELTPVAEILAEANEANKERDD